MANNIYYGQGHVIPALNGFNIFGDHVKQMYNTIEALDAQTGKGTAAMRDFLLLADLPSQNKIVGPLVIGITRSKEHPIVKLLPLTPVTQTVFKNTITEFEPSLLGLVPEQGIARLLRWRQRTITSQMERYGLAHYITADVLRSEEGPRIMNDTFTHIIVTVQRTIPLVVFKALSEASEPGKFRDIVTDMADEVVYTEYILECIHNFAICNKRATGVMEMIDFQRKKMEEETSLTPNALVVPQTKLSSVRKLNPMYTEHHLGGDKAVEHFNNAMTGDVSVNGIKIIDVPGFQNIDNRFRTAVSTQRYVNGRFERITHHPGADTGQPAMVWIYDNTTGGRTAISIKDIFANDIHFRNEGNARFSFNFNEVARLLWNVQDGNVPVHASLDDSPFLQEYENGQIGWANWLFNGHERDYDNPPIATRNNVKLLTIDEWLSVDNGNKTRFSAMTMRPLDAGFSDFGLLVRGGSELGFTGHSPEMFEFGTDPTNSTRTLDFRIYLGAHIRDPRGVVRIDHAFYAGTISGGGCGLLNKDAADNLKRGGFRLNGPRAPCMYGILYPTERRDYASGMMKPTFDNSLPFIHLSGKSPAIHNNGDRILDYPGAKLYSRFYGWDVAESMNRMNEPVIASYLCEGSYSYMTPTGMINVPGKTHHGPNEGTFSPNIRMSGIGVVPS